MTGVDNAPATTLLAVPNVSEGRDDGAIAQIAEAFTRGTPDARVLDVHRDPDHHRSVFTLAGAPGTLAHAVLDGARKAVARIDLREHQGVHPRIGAIDVAPIVYLRPEDQGAACAEALVLGDLLGDELELPVFLYGVLADGRTRAELRRGGPTELSARIEAGELRPDFGPDHLHPTAGAALVGARPPLVAFNIELAAGVTLDEARHIASAIRDGGSEGLPSLRALGVWLTERGVAQVSMNLDDHTATTLAAIVEAISIHAAPTRAEVVGLIPESALQGFPENIPLDCAGTVEQALAAAPKTAPESDAEND